MLTTASRPFLGSEFPDDHYSEICAILLEKRDFDLGWYKDKCIKRRIAIRVRALGFHDARDYAAVLREDDQELEALLTTLTIHVTQFFRNPSMFELLASRLLPQKLSAENGSVPYRIWSVGCASGEEPYTLALLVAELGQPPGRVEILGTDISGAVLDKARAACFDRERLRELPPRLLERYFVQAGRHFQLSGEIVRRVRFLRQDILSDPFPAADLIMCRNVLIYFSRAEQERILEGFAKALAPGGVLVLGKSETLIGQTRDRFEAYDSAERIFIRT